MQKSLVLPLEKKTLHPAIKPALALLLRFWEQLHKQWKHILRASQHQHSRQLKCGLSTEATYPPQHSMNKHDSLCAEWLGEMVFISSNTHFSNKDYVFKPRHFHFAIQPTVPCHIPVELSLVIFGHHGEELDIPSLIPYSAIQCEFNHQPSKGLLPA